MRSLLHRLSHLMLYYVLGYLYAVGGHDGINYLKTVEKYNPATNAWTCVASMGARRGGVGVATLGGCLYATGGYDGTSNLSTSGNPACLNSRLWLRYKKLYVMFLMSSDVLELHASLSTIPRGRGGALQ